MFLFRSLLPVVAVAGLIVLPPVVEAQQKKAKKWSNTWTDPTDKTLPVDFKFQGEYKGDQIGCQVIALDKGRFSAVVFPGGLPGDGWGGKNKIVMDGKLADDKVTFVPAKGKRQYKAGGFEKFSPTSTFPPVGQKDYNATLSGDALTITTDDGKTLALKKTLRVSKTLGEQPPKGALILFDGSNKDEWNGGRIEEGTKTMNTDGNDIVSKKKFTNYRVHLEFMTPFRPAERDQGRGNSGFYQVDTYEVQVLDSFGLDGKLNECGGIYKWRDSRINMCFPPLTWQTYDVEFTNAVLKDGKIDKKARITVKLNGITVHDDFELPGPNGGGRDDKYEGTPGPFKLQGHGNPVQYRNIWLVEKK